MERIVKDKTFATHDEKQCSWQSAKEYAFSNGKN
jgi:hypothetical protein